MAINSKDFKKTKYPHIKQNKKDKTLFLFDIVADSKRYRKQYRHNGSQDIYTLFLEWSSKVGIKTTEDAVTVEDYFHLSQRLSERSNSSKSKYESYFILYVSQIASIKVSDVKSQHIDKLNLATKHLKPSYRKKMYEILIPAFNLAIDDGLIDKSPIKKRQVVKRKQMEEMRVVTDAITKYKLLHKAIHTVFKYEPRIRALFLFGFSGRRKTETLNLKWSDINLANGEYVVRGSISKISADMTFVMADDLKEALTMCMSLSDVYVFQSPRVTEPKPISDIKDHVKKIRDVTFEEFTFHLMRNISVSALAASGADSLDLSSMLGHLDNNTLKKYLSLQREGASRKTNSISSQLLFG